jgi:type II secretory pathway component GspD/PulD (secretin)
MIGYSALAVVLMALGDMPFPDVDLSQTKAEQPQYTDFPLMEADAARCVKKLRRLLGEDGYTRIVSDERTNTVFIKASPEKLQRAKEILDRMDRPSYRSLIVLPLAHTDASTIAPKLQTILAFFAWLADDDRPIMIFEEFSGKKIIFAGSKEAQEQARVLVRLLDVEKK